MLLALAPFLPAQGFRNNQMIRPPANNPARNDGNNLPKIVGLANMTANGQGQAVQVPPGLDLAALAQAFGANNTNTFNNAGMNQMTGGFGGLGFMPNNPYANAYANVPMGGYGGYQGYQGYNGGPYGYSPYMNAGMPIGSFQNAYPGNPYMNPYMNPALMNPATNPLANPFFAAIANSSSGGANQSGITGVTGITNVGNPFQNMYGGMMPGGMLPGMMPAGLPGTPVFP